MNKYVEAEEISLVYSGNNYFDVLEKMADESTEVLHLQTYIFATDETGFRVIEALRRAAARGVRVFMMVDAYASFPFPREIAESLHGSGVHFRLYAPLLSSEAVFIGRRMHHKIVVADRRVGLIGGINIADKYNNIEGETAWLDYAVLIRGDVCEYLHLRCEQFFRKRRPGALHTWEKNTWQLPSPGTDSYVRFRQNDWIKRRNEIHKSYIEGILKAEKEIVLIASYFLPGNNLRRLLRGAAARGVSIHVVMTGRSDVLSLRLAEHYLYDFYLRHRIRLYEWPHSVLHGKAMIVDRTWVTIGSYNLNFLSHYVSIELNADIIDRKFVNEFADHLGDIMQNHSREIEIVKENRAKRFFLYQFLLWLAYNFYRLLMMLALRSKKYREKLHS
jgi:cardiolipin synthase A/B